MREHKRKQSIAVAGVGLVQGTPLIQWCSPLIESKDKAEAGSYIMSSRWPWKTKSIFEKFYHALRISLSRPCNAVGGVAIHTRETPARLQTVSGQIFAFTSFRCFITYCRPFGMFAHLLFGPFKNSRFFSLSTLKLHIQFLELRKSLRLIEKKKSCKSICWIRTRNPWKSAEISILDLEIYSFLIIFLHLKQMASTLKDGTLTWLGKTAIENWSWLYVINRQIERGKTCFCVATRHFVGNRRHSVTPVMKLVNEAIQSKQAIVYWRSAAESLSRMPGRGECHSLHIRVVQC